MEKIFELIQSVIVLILMIFGGSDAAPPPVATPPLPDGSYIQVHFIDVGQADAALVICDGEAMLIDGGNTEDSSLLYSYLKQYGIDHLDFVVGTHAHEDHIGGIAGALHYADTDMALCPVTEYDSEAFDNFKKTLTQHGVSITVPSVGDTYALGSAQVEILACDPNNSEPNNTGIVLRIIHGETTFLFTGDVEREVEQRMLDESTDLRSTVLKVAHHGSSTGTGYHFLYEVQPKYAVISVGKDNSYSHPDEEVTSRLQDADVTVYRTDENGDIICTGDGKTVTFTTEK